MRQRWKQVGLGFLTLLAIGFAIAGAQPLLRKSVSPELGPALIAVIVLVVYVASSYAIERRIPTELAPRHALSEVAIGIAIGFVLFSATMAILWAIGVYHPSGWGSTRGMAAAFALAIMAGIAEEIIFRGLMYRLSARIVGTWGAIVFTSALFGLAHLANKGATIFSGVAIMLEAGILLSAAYAFTGRLWLPIGLHIGWNFTEGSVYGMQISGNTIGDSLLRGSLSGPPLLTGGAFGPEASLVAVAVCLAMAIFLLYRTIRLGRIEPPAWKHAATLPIAVSV